MTIGGDPWAQRPLGSDREIELSVTTSFAPWTEWKTEHLGKTRFRTLSIGRMELVRIAEVYRFRDRARWFSVRYHAPNRPDSPIAGGQGKMFETFGAALDFIKELAG